VTHQTVTETVVVVRRARGGVGDIDAGDTVHRVVVDDDAAARVEVGGIGVKRR
jgi:hypothetical protein